MKKKNPHAQALGRLGGIARAKTLSDEQRRAISAHANAIKKKRARLQRLYGASPLHGEDQ